MVAAAVLSTPFWSTVTAQAATTTNASVIYVSTTGSDTAGTGTAANPYQTISHAVAVAAPATTIIFEPGTYEKSVTISKDVTLESDSSQKNAVANTAIDATGFTNGIVVNGAGAAGTVISGLTVENANDHGIWVKDTSNVTVMGNVIDHNGLVPATIKTTAIQEDKSILLEGTAYSVVANNTVDNNTITNNFIPSVIVHRNTPGDVVDGNVVVGNTMSMNGPAKAVGDARPTGIALIGAVLPVTNDEGSRQHDC